VVFRHSERLGHGDFASGECLLSQTAETPSDLDQFGKVFSDGAWEAQMVLEEGCSRATFVCTDPTIPG
jgi:hypothetical protein